jgi:hypothetical protein
MKLITLLTATLIATTLHSAAAVVININQSGDNVVATITGSINSLAGATLSQANGFVVSYNYVRGSDGTFATTPTGGTSSYNKYNVSTVPSAFGTGSAVLASSSTANVDFSIRTSPSPELFIASSYALGTAMTGTLTWNNKTIASMGLTEGTYVWGWTGDSVTINISTEAIPEPSSALLGLLGTAFLFRRRRSS